MKINFKLGGTNHQIHGSTGLKSRTIVFGADVTHSGKGQDPGCPSLAGVVASSGDGNNTYLASARLQSNNTEVRPQKSSACEDADKISSS